MKIKVFQLTILTNLIIVLQVFDAHTRSEAVSKALVTCNSKITFSRNQISTK